MDIGNKIGKEIGEILKEDMSSIIALFPGKMKPPHKGHFTVVKEACKIADEVMVIISPKYKDEFGPEQSKKIWEQYKKLLPSNVNITISKSESPISEIYDIVKDKSNDYLVIYGKGEEQRYESIIKNRDKYNNVEVVNAGNFENISSTNLREAIRKRNLNQIQTFLPEGVNADKFMYNFSIHEGKKNESIMGGLADSATIEDLAKMHNVSLSNILSQLDKGVKVEMEHTDNPDIAYEIAMDHIYEDPKYYDKLATISLEEGKNLGTLYHFTKVGYIQNILNDNELRGTEINMKSQWDHDTKIMRDRFEKSRFSKDREELYYISFTRDKLLYKKNPKIKGFSARMVFDGNKLSHNNKFIPVSYFSDEMDDDQSRYDQNEGEERLVLKNDTSIYNVKNYIKEIHILLDVIMDSHYLKYVDQLYKTNNPLIKYYWKEKEVDYKDWLQVELPKMEPYRGEEIDESINKTLNEIYTDDKKTILDKLVDYCCDKLDITPPEIVLIKDENYSKEQKSFGGYSPTEQKIYVVVRDRHTADIMRTLAHELVHHKQQLNNELEVGAGEDGDEFENEANSKAAVFMREFGRKYPEIFE